MKTVSSGFKTAIKTNGRQISAKLTIGSYTLTTDQINGIILNTNGQNYKSCMKSVEIDLNIKIPVGSIVKVEFGVKVNNSYEYLNYGDFIIKSNDKNEGTRSYTMMGYDYMMLSMQDYSLDLTYTGSTTIDDLLQAICNKLGYTLLTTDYANKTSIISSDVFSGKGYKYRDVLDDIAEVVGGMLVLDGTDLTIKYPTETDEVIDNAYLKDTNVNINEKYGKLNKVTFNRGDDVDPISLTDESTAYNGITELKFTDNFILNSDDRDNFLQDLFDKVKGTEYYLCDVDSTGICFLETGDLFTIAIGNDALYPSSTLYPSKTLYPRKRRYKVLLLNDEIKISQGLEENINTEKVEEKVEEYSNVSTVDKKIKTTTIRADQISLIGKTIDLTGDSITIESDNFNVDSEGNVTMNDAIVYGDVYFPNSTTKVIGDTGLLTTSQYQSSNIGWYSGIDKKEGFWLLGYNDEATIEEVYANYLELRVFIPDNFVITSAKVTFQHYPVWWYVNEVWGYCRNINIYTVSNESELYIGSAYASDILLWNTPVRSIITDAMGSGGYTPSDPTTNSQLEEYVSADISSSLATGDNLLHIKTSDATPSWSEDNDNIASKTGYAQAIINIIGYYKYE